MSPLVFLIGGGIALSILEGLLTRRRILDLWAVIVDGSRQTGVSPALIAGVIEVETRGRSVADPRGRFFGAMQVGEAAARSVGFVGPLRQLLDPAVGVAVGATYLRDQLRRYGGNVRQAVSAYNAGHFTQSNRRYVDRVVGAMLGWTPAGQAGARAEHTA